MKPLCSCRRRLLGLAGLASLTALVGLVGCGRQADAPLAAAEINASSACDLDGMLLADYPGPKVQIHYVGQADPVWLCDTVEMFSTLLRPEQVRAVRAVYVQDMGQADWTQPRGHWFEANTGVYVLGSKRHGSMGPTIASFRQQADAERHVAEWGGKILRFSEVTSDMVDLSGGALHDSKM